MPDRLTTNIGPDQQAVARDIARDHAGRVAARTGLGPIADAVADDSEWNRGFPSRTVDIDYHADKAADVVVSHRIAGDPTDALDLIRRVSLFAQSMVDAGLDVRVSGALTVVVRVPPDA